jgi:hypothetical protein
MRIGCNTSFGHYYRVPDYCIGSMVWTILKGNTLWMEWDREVIFTFEIEMDYLKAFTHDS